MLIPYNLNYALSEFIRLQGFDPKKRSIDIGRFLYALEYSFKLLKQQRSNIPQIGLVWLELKYNSCSHDTKGVFGDIVRSNQSVYVLMNISSETMWDIVRISVREKEICLSHMN